MHRDAIGAAALAMSATAVCAQTDATFLLISSNTVSLSSPTTTIGIWATWTDPGHAFGFSGANYDLAAGDGNFSNPVNALGGPGSWTGLIAGNVVSGAANGQMSFGFLPRNLDNPILMATYDWTTTDFSRRAVSLETSHTTFFNVFAISTTSVFSIFSEFTPGSGVINVIPAPAAWLVLALPLLAPRRRRRC